MGFVTELLLEKDKCDILRQFDIPGDILSIKPYGNGHINDTYCVLTKHGEQSNTYILQKVNTYVFRNPEQLMFNIHQITEFLFSRWTAAGYTDADRRVARVMFTKEGAPFYKDEQGEVWRMMPFLEDTICYEVIDSKERFYECGLAFGDFIFQLLDFPVENLYETIPDFHNTPVRLQRLWAAAQEDRLGRAGQVQEELQFIKDREEECSYFMNKYQQGLMPLRVTHNDTKLNNILFDRNTKKALCVIDLDTVMPGFAAFDFGDAIRFGACTGAEDERDLNKIQLDLSLYHAYRQGFLEGVQEKLTQEETESLAMGAKVMTLESAIRFLTDYLEGDVYFKTEREGQNLDRCRTQLKLAADMEKKWDMIN